MSINLETVDSNPSVDDPTPTLRNSTTLDESEPMQQNPEVSDEAQQHPNIKMHYLPDSQKRGTSTWRKQLYKDRPDIEENFEADNMWRNPLMAEQDAIKHDDIATPTKAT